MTVLGMIQGRITFDHSEDFSNLTLPDQTGPEVLDSISLGHNLSGSIPVVVPPDGTLLPRVASSGNKGIGYSNPQKPVETSLAVIPMSELGGGLLYNGTTWTRLAGNGYAAASGAGAAPKLALFAWRVRLSYGSRSWGVEDGGREICQSTSRRSTASTRAYRKVQSSQSGATRLPSHLPSLDSSSVPLLSSMDEQRATTEVGGEDAAHFCIPQHWRKSSSGKPTGGRTGRRHTPGNLHHRWATSRSRWNWRATGSARLSSGARPTS
jgi:hypothetical protein